MRLISIGIVIAACLMAVSCPSSAFSQQSDQMMLKLDLSYGDHDAQKLDIYAPSGAKDAAVMVYVHGGGWMIGDKNRAGKKPAFFTEKGWVLVSVNYRLLPDGRHPKNVEDVARALAWVADHISEYGGDPDSIFLMGHSAGCHLVSLAATDPRPLKKAGKSLGLIKGVIALDTSAYDIPSLITQTGSAIYIHVFGKGVEGQKDASPLHHIAAGREIPPFLVCFSRGMGRQVNPVRRTQAEAFVAALKKAGVAVEMIDASDRSHSEINQRFGDPTDTKVTDKAMTFLEKIRKAR